MKVGTLIRWRPDGDLGIVIENNIPIPDNWPDETRPHFKIAWTQSGDAIAILPLPHKNVEILNESR